MIFLSQLSTTTRAILQFFVILLSLLLAILLAPRPFLSIFMFGEKEKVIDDSIVLQNYLENRLGSLTEIRQKHLQPDFLAVNLPEDLSQRPLDKRTSLFITLVLSHGFSSNKLILMQRKKLILYILDKKAGRFISLSRKNWLTQLADKYSVSGATPEMLLERVDIIPVSLIIAQAITESGWGTSRFALQGNALYGQHLAKNSNNKFIISRYGNVKIASFDSINDATASYIHNINTAKAYKDLRGIRSSMRSQQIVLSGYSLAKGLKYYSERGNEYIANLRYIIQKYNLEHLDSVVPPQYSPVTRVRFSRQDKAS